jgi:methionyl-tRNA formyltransferase
MAGVPPPFASEDRNTRLRIVFMGTPAIAARILDRLVEGSGASFEVAGVVTRPDQPRGRGLAVEPSEVAAIAALHGIPTLKPVKIRTPEFLSELKCFSPDLIVVAAYGRILPAAVLDAARIMPLNVHASLLPRHRGAAPIEGAILAGDVETGVTIMRMTERMDAGPILLQRRAVMASDETQASLKTKLAEIGAEALLEALDKLAHGALSESAQDESHATYTSPVKKQDAIIDWNADAVQIERMTRAYNPWPVARTTLDGAELLIHRAAVEDPHARAEAPGTIVKVKPEPTVQCAIGTLVLLEVQAPGRKRMAAADFMRGRRIGVGHRLGS